MNARTALHTALVVLTGCAGVPRGAGAGYRFPGAFDTTQAVTVTLDGVEREMVASVRRRGADLEVTLFDPVFSFPLLSATARAGRRTEVRHVDALHDGDGLRLLRLLGGVFEARYDSDDPTTAGTSATSGRTRLTDLAGGAACRFPGVIELSPRFGPVSRIQVRTLGISCPEEGDGT